MTYGKCPPEVAGTVQPRRRDRPRIAWWSLKGPWVMGFGRKHRLRDDRRVAYLCAGVLGMAFVAGAGQAWSVDASFGVIVAWGVATAALAALLTFAALVGLVIRTRTGRRWYMTEDRDAAIEVAIKTDRQRIGKRSIIQTDTWTVSNHLVQQIGSNAGAKLRTTLIGPLLRAADAADDPVYLVAASPQHARLYRIEVDGLVDIGREQLRGRKMYRLRRSDRERIANVTNAALS